VAVNLWQACKALTFKNFGDQPFNRSFRDKILLAVQGFNLGAIQLVVLAIAQQGAARTGELRIS